MSNPENKRVWWPPADSEANAQKLLRYAVVACCFTAGATALVAAWSIGAHRQAFGFINAFSFIDVAIFAGLAFGVSKGYRWAATCAFFLFIVEKFDQVARTGSVNGAPLAIILGISYWHGVRGAFALHRMRKSIGPVS